MASPLRQQVLGAFRRLHRTRRRVFADDAPALAAARLRINDEFRRQATVRDSAAVAELLRLADDCELVLRTSVMQARRSQQRPDTFSLRISADTVMFDNVPFKEDVVMASGDTSAPGRCGCGGTNDCSQQR